MIHKIYNKIRGKVRDASVHMAHFIHRLTHDYSYVDGVIAKYWTPDLKKNIHQPYKLWMLIKILEKEKPKKILEFGSGSSTMIFADYAAKNGAEVISVESDEAWAEKARTYLAGNDNVKIVFAKALGFADKTPPELKYDINFDEVFDLVFIDGPGGHFEGIARKTGATVNAVELKDPKLVLIDGRKATVHYMKERMKTHICKESELHSPNPVKPGYNYFSAFSKK
jgi:precorrin-6B methylase 2